MSAPEISLPLRVGARTWGTLRRRLARRFMTLEEALSGVVPDLPPLADGDHGYLINALATSSLESLAARHKNLRLFVRQRYRRSYASLVGSFDDYLTTFSAKSRSTLMRKSRKLAKRSGGELQVKAFAKPEEMIVFYKDARAVSETTYQERLLGAGLPEGPEAIENMRALAARDAVRAWLLFLDGSPIAYLYAPAEGKTLIYAYLGYDPAFAEFSPGIVLQIEAMRRLMGEDRFRLFDFTEGEGQHKRQFATGEIECVDLLLVKPTLANLGVAVALTAFDGAIAAAKRLVNKIGGAAVARRLRR